MLKLSDCVTWKETRERTGELRLRIKQLSVLDMSDDEQDELLSITTEMLWHLEGSNENLEEALTILGDLTGTEAPE